jgi:hypothetical protein
MRTARSSVSGPFRRCIDKEGFDRAAFRARAFVPPPAGQARRGPAPSWDSGCGLDLAESGFVCFEPGRFFAGLRHHDASFQDRRCVGFLHPENEVPL